MLYTPSGGSSPTTFGVTCDLTTFDEMVAVASEAIEVRAKIDLCYMNLHGAYLYKTTPIFRKFIDSASRVYIDGFPIILWRKIVWGDGELIHHFTLTHKLPDLLRICAAQSWPVFYVGSKSDVLQRGISTFSDSTPGLEFSGHHGFFDKDPASHGSREVIRKINQSGAKILLLGMGMPTQEEWACSVRHQLEVPVVWTCGGALEYYSGESKIAPYWLNKVGGEWIFRLLNKPSRFGRRYLVEPLFLIPTLFTDLQNRMKHLRMAAIFRKSF